MNLKNAKYICDDFIKKIKNEITSFEVDDNFIQIIEDINNIEGKIIFTGIGKSGLLARKISATFASLGKSSFFIHLAEMMHGDIGMISKKDCLIIISVSGEANEFQYIVEYCNAINVKIFSILRNKDSFLAKNSIPIYIKYTNDLLDEYNIPAPIVSSLLTMMTGDLLAICLARINNFSSSDYAKCHPGGKIGFFTKKIEDVLIKIENITSFSKENLFSDIMLNYCNAKDKSLIYCIEDENIYIFDVEDFQKNNPLKNELKIINFSTQKIAKINYNLSILEIHKSFTEFDYFAIFKEDKLTGFYKKKFL